MHLGSRNKFIKHGLSDKFNTHTVVLRCQTSYRCTPQKNPCRNVYYFLAGIQKCKPATYRRSRVTSSCNHRRERAPLNCSLLIVLQRVVINVFNVMLKLSTIVPRVETMLYNGWSSSKAMTNLRPAVLPRLFETCKNSVMFLKGQVNSVCMYYC